MGLLDEHKSELSALNAIVQLTGGGGGAGGATEITLSEINDKIPDLGQADSANSVPVVIASDQPEILVSIPSGVTVSSSSLPTGASTSLLQNASLTELQQINSNVNSIYAGLDTQVGGQAGQTAVGRNILLPTAGTGPTSTIATRSIAIQIIPTGTVSSGVVTFEGSNDGNIWFSLLLYDEVSVSSNPVSSFIPTTGVTRFFAGNTHFAFIRARISTVIGGGGSLQAFSILRRDVFQPTFHAVTQATGSNLNMTGTITSTSLVPGVTATNLGKAEDAVAAPGDTGVFTLGVRRDALTSSSSATGDYSEHAISQYGSQLIKSEDKHARTYSASAQVAPTTDATDIMLIPGNGTSTVYVTKIIISGIATTARLQDIQITKRTAINTGGTSSSMSVGQHDSLDAAPSSTPITYTANPSALGTSGGILRRTYAALGISASSDDNVLTFEFGDKGRPVVLRAATQSLAVNLKGTATIAGDTINISVEWYEI